MLFYAFYAVALIILILHFTGWLKRNPWFMAELVPVLRQRLGSLLGETGK